MNYFFLVAVGVAVAYVSGVFVGVGEIVDFFVLAGLLGVGEQPMSGITNKMNIDKNIKSFLTIEFTSSI